MLRITASVGQDRNGMFSYNFRLKGIGAAGIKKAGVL